MYTNDTSVKVFIGHKCLKYLQAIADNDPRLITWTLTIKQCNLEINYVPGKYNSLADGQSRSFMKNVIYCHV